MPSRENSRLLIVGGMIALILAATMAVANGSHIEVSFQNGPNFNASVGVRENWLVSMLGCAGVAALIAGAIGWTQNPPSPPAADSTQPPPPSAWERLRHLTLSKTDCQVGGVCGGLGEHTAIPSWMWRAAFLVLLFWVGTGFLAYIILWICVPNPKPADAEPPRKSP